MSELSSLMEEMENKTCTLTVYRGFLVHCSVPISIVMVLILSFMQRTKKDRRTGSSNWFRENFSLIFPVDLYENHDRLAFCLAFGASSSMVLDLLFNDYTAYLFHKTPPGWSKILIGSILTIEISIDCFPTFACITSRSRLLSNAMGFIYNVFWFVMMVLFCISCEQAEQTMGRKQIPQIVPQIPVVVCLFLLSVYFLVEFIRVFIKRYKGIKITPEERLMKTHQAVYVKNLLSKPKEVVYRGWSAKVFKNYKPHPGFKFPTRLFMACSMSVLALYQVALWFIELGMQLLNEVMGLISGLAQAELQLKNETMAAADIALKLDQVHSTLIVAWYVASGLSIFLLLSYIPAILKNYRTHLLNLFAGKHEPLPPHVKLPTEDYIVGSLKYIGFQVAFFLSGYMSVQITVFLLVGGLAILIRAIIWYTEAILINVILQLALPSMVIGISVMFCQTLFVRFLFTQDKIKPDDEDKPLAIQHKVWFLIFSFVMMYLNILYGIIMAIIRFLIGILGLTLYLARIDQPILMPSIPDMIYNVYVGNMYSENAHSNPVLVTFCHLMVFDILRSQRKHRKLKRLTDRGFAISQEINAYSDLEEETDEEKGPTKPIGLFKHFRWYVAITLINNPSLIQLRKRPAVSLNEEVTLLNGELKVVDIGADGGGQRNMMPHMVEVIKRHQLDKKRSSIDAANFNLGDLLVDDIQPVLEGQLPQGSSSSKGLQNDPGSTC